MGLARLVNVQIMPRFNWFRLTLVCDRPHAKTARHIHNRASRAWSIVVRRKRLLRLHLPRLLPHAQPQTTRIHGKDVIKVFSTNLRRSEIRAIDS